MKERDIKEEAGFIFHKAANYIRDYGWRVSGMSRHGLPRCSMGALASAHRHKTWDEKLAKLMYDELYRELNGMSLTEFNYFHKDGEEIALLFDKVAQKLNKPSAVQRAEAVV